MIVFISCQIAACSSAPDSFLYTTSTKVIYLAWTNANGSLSGQLQEVSTNSPTTYTSSQASFHGTLSGQSVSLDFGGFLGYSIVTGTFDGNTLMLNMPAGSGELASYTFVPGSIDDYNKAVTTLETTIAAADATATSIAQASQTVTNDNYQVYQAYWAVHNTTADLYGNEQVDEITQVKNDYIHMQTDYTQEQNDAMGGCENGQISADDRQIQADYNQIQADLSYYQSLSSAMNSDISKLTSLIPTLQTDWQTLQNDMQHNPSGMPQPHFTNDSIQKDIRIAQQVMATASHVLQQDQQQIPPYGQNALFLKQQADNLYLSLHC